MPHTVDIRSRVFLAGLAHKTLRFLITSGVPLIAAYWHGLGSWILYLALGGILGFVGDAGGPPLLRLGFMAVGPASIGLGALIGTWCFFGQADWAFFCIAVLIGVVYALVENRHGHMVMVPRFVGYGLAFGYSVTPLDRLDALLLALALLWAWLVSMLWDTVTRRKQPFSVPSLRRSILRGYVHAPLRWRLALSTGIAVGLALLTTVFTGNRHAYWTMLTMLIVLHYNINESALHITRRITGTVIGVFFVILLVKLGATPLQLLLAEMSIPVGINPMPVLIDRLLATFIGCAFSLLTLELDAFLQLVLCLCRRLARCLKQPDKTDR
jgi:hypothetical protein